MGALGVSFDCSSRLVVELLGVLAASVMMDGGACPKRTTTAVAYAV